MTPTVSVVIPTLGRPVMVTDAVTSVLAQTVDDLEVIVVVDGPDRATVQALERFDDRRLRVVVHDENQGCSTGRNTGIAAATGRWVALLDDDDLWRPTKLARQLETAAATGARWVLCDSISFDGASGEIVGLNQLGDLSDLRHRFTGGNPLHGGPSAALIETGLLRSVGGFDTTLAANEDFDLWVRLAARAACVNVAQPLMAYRVSTTSMSTDIEAMREAGVVLGARIGADQVEAGGSRYLARQALNGGDRFGASAEFLRCARRYRSGLDLARAGLALTAPGWLRAQGRRRSAAALDDTVRCELAAWLATFASPGNVPPPPRPAERLGLRAAGLPVVGPRLAARLLEGRHGRRLQPEGRDLVADVGRALSLDPAVVSVDVFETLLVRRVVGQAAIESAVEARLVADGLWPGPAGSFRAARGAAIAGAPEAGLTHWYDREPLAPVTDAAAAIEAEVEVERELTAVVPGARAALDEIRRSAAGLVLLSDMYLDTGALRAVLDHHGLITDDDRLVVSCDHGATKQGGRLYDVLERPAVHVGNNHFIDGAMAAAEGVTPIVADRGNPTRYEELLAVDGGSLGPVVAGAARLARLRLSADRSASGTEVFGTQVLGPMLASFLLWIRRSLASTDHRHIAFLARDGELPYRMAQAMPGDYWKDHGLEYLHSSRASWSLAAASVIGVDEWVRAGTADGGAFLDQLATAVPLSSLLRRTGLELGDVPAGSPLAGRRPEQPIEDGDVVHWERLLHDPEIQALIDRRSRPRRDEIIDHLHQSGLPPQPIALVDVGWRGQAAWFVSALIGEATGHQPIHLHFGGDGVIPAIDRRIDIRRFALDDSRWPHPIDSPVSCVEMFLAAGQRRLTGYRRTADGTVEQVFSPTGSAVDTEAVRALWRGATAVAAELPPAATVESWLTAPSGPDLLVAEVRSLLAAFWNHPDRSEVADLAGLRFEHDSSGDSIGDVVRPYRLPELIRRDPLARQWRAGSLAITGPATRALFTAAHRMRSVAANR